MKRKNEDQLAMLLKIDPARALEARLKAKLIGAVLKVAEKKKITHNELASRAGIPRSAVTGILSGSLQKVTLDRVLRLVYAARLRADVSVREAA